MLLCRVGVAEDVGRGVTCRSFLVIVIAGGPCAKAPVSSSYLYLQFTRVSMPMWSYVLNRTFPLDILIQWSSDASF